MAMGDHHHARSTTSMDFYSIVGIKNASIKAYKSLFTKWQPHHDKSPSKNPEDDENTHHNEAKAVSNARKETLKSFVDQNLTSSSPSPGGSNHHKSVDDSLFLKPSVLLRSLSSRHSSTSLRRSVSRRSFSPSRDGSVSSTHQLNSSPKSDVSVSRSTHQLTSSLKSGGSVSRSTSIQASLSPKSDGSLFKSMNQTGNSDDDQIPTMSRSMSRRGSTTPIVYSQSTARRKPTPIETKLECALEELCHGCVKHIKISREVMRNGLVEQEEEMLKIQVKPGWRKGTKITFEGKGDERPGYYPADVIFVIDEKRHNLFKREGDDLEYAIEIPLVKAVTGCSIPVPLLGGEKMTLFFDEVLYPGFEKIIRGQGMPLLRDEGKRGNLRIKFFVDFTLDLTDEQRREVSRILDGCE